jgi:hypothetical protein
MSRLADRITRVARPGAVPMGFGRAAERHASPTLLCLLRLDKEYVGKVGDAAAKGADAVIISGVDAGKLAQAVKKLGDLPAGLRVENAEREAVAAARGAGVDFVLLDEGASAEAVVEEGVGLALSVGTDTGDTELRVLAGLPLDALEVPAVGEPLTLRGMLELRRLSLLSQTPLLVEVQPQTDASRLQALREAGAIGVILDGKHADKLEALREAVLSLPPKGRRREERTEAVLPSLTAVPTEEEEEEPEYP